VAEFRRLTGALQNYRNPRQRGQFVVVKQQNLASGNQQIALLDGTSPPSPSTKLQKNDPNTELNCDQPLSISHEPVQAAFPEPKTSGSREKELAETRPVDTGKPRKAPRRHAKKPAVEEVDRPENG
jgi:hypothetical protein